MPKPTKRTKVHLDRALRKSDITALEKRGKEPLISFGEMRKRLKKAGKI